MVALNIGLTVIVSVVVVAHCPDVGVKVYSVVAVLFIAGLHVPVMAGVFVELVGNAGIVAPEQYGPTGANVGVITAAIVTDVVAVAPGQPPLGARVYVTVYVPAVLVPGVIEPFAEIVNPAGNAE